MNINKQIFTGEAKTTRDRDANETCERVSFDVKDAKGRTIGAALRRGVHTFTEKDDATVSSYYTAKPGTYFYFRPWATRDGAEYGASQYEQYYATEADREAGIALYLANARKRAAKKGA